PRPRRRRRHLRPVPPADPQAPRRRRVRLPRALRPLRRPRPGPRLRLRRLRAPRPLELPRRRVLPQGPPRRAPGGRRVSVVVPMRGVERAAPAPEPANALAATDLPARIVELVFLARALDDELDRLRLAGRVPGF